MTDAGGGCQLGGSGPPRRTEAITSVMARTDSAAGSASSSNPGWVDFTVPWMRCSAAALAMIGVRTAT
jgi:hypothetical protein